VSSRSAEEWQPGGIPLGREEESGVVGKRALSNQHSAISKEQLTKAFYRKGREGRKGRILHYSSLCELCVHCG
jgi:hypothetical protein